MGSEHAWTNRTAGFLTRLQAGWNRRWEALIRLLVRRPWTALALLLGSALAAGWIGSHVEIRTNMEDLFPESSPHVARAKEVREKLGFSSQVKLILGSPDREANLRFAQDLSRRLEAHPMIQSVELRRDVDFFRKNALLFLSNEELLDIKEKVREKVRRVVAKEIDPFGGEPGDGAPVAAPSFEDDPEGDFEEEEAAPAAPAPVSAEADAEGRSFEIPSEDEIRARFGLTQFTEYQTSADGTVLSLSAIPTIAPNNVSASRTLIADLNEILTDLDPGSYHPKMEYAIEGDYHRKIEDMKVINRDLTVSSLLGFGLVLTLVILYFGRFRAILFAMAPLGVGFAWTMGFIYLTVGYLNMITAFIYSVLFGLGVDFQIHTTSRYMEERARGLGVEEAAVSAVLKVGRAIFEAALTTTATFYCLVLFEFRGFSQFGWIAGTGVLFSVLAAMLVIPPLIVAADRVRKERTSNFATRFARIPAFARNPRNAAITLGLVLLAVFALALGTPYLKFESDMSRVAVKKKPERIALITKYKAQVSRTSASPIIVPTASLEETRQVQRHFEANLSMYPWISECSSVWSFVPDGQAEKLPIIAEIRRTIERKLGAMEGEDKEDAERALKYLRPEAFTAQDLPPWVRAKFSDRQGNLGTFAIIYARGNKADAMHVKGILDEVDQIQVGDKTFFSSASYYIAYDAFDIVQKEGPLATLLGALVVLLIIWIDLRRVRVVLISAIPVSLGIVAFLGVCGLAGWDLNIFNMVILPNLFGIGIDTSTHLAHRVMQDAGWDPVARRPTGIGRLVGATGSAAAMSSITTASGFLAMSVATNPGLSSMGIMAPIGILLCYIASVTITGTLLWFWLPKDALHHAR